MYLDELPDAAIARNIKVNARGRPIISDGRAVGVAFIGDGTGAPESRIVRFDIAAGQDARKLLADAMAMTGATSVWYFGGDAVTRQAVNDLGLESTPDIGLFVRRAEPVAGMGRLSLRGAQDIDDETRRLVSRHIEFYENPRYAAALAGGEVVGYAILQELSATWSEVSAFVLPLARRKGNGTEILAKASDAAEHTGRMVCAAAAFEDASSRGMLERAGFRLADYYFIARMKPKSPLLAENR